MEVFDDLDGEKIASGGETIQFSVDGVEYSIDLKDENSEQLRRLLRGYIRHARRVGGHKRWAAIGPASGNGLHEVRRWARAHGYRLNRGSRIPQAVLEDYAAAHVS
ncbi:Lsr2 family protein [Rhodococcus sp. TAF43]|uniref:histone-like nucleoid-structuring protein Lsr2 n=1 Tax=Rhodococcus sp. TAF43 TaxID=3237483 RepID=UPI003F96E345